MVNQVRAKVHLDALPRALHIAPPPSLVPPQLLFIFSMMKNKMIPSPNENMATHEGCVALYPSLFKARVPVGTLQAGENTYLPSDLGSLENISAIMFDDLAN
ncbi:hypothetical protein WN943_010451 [Citrus x changshan-huyou]